MTRGVGGRRFEWVVVGCVLALLFAVPVVMSVTSGSSGPATLTGAGAEGSADPGADAGDPVRLAAPAPAADARSRPPPTGHARAAVLAAEAAAAPNTELAVAVYDRVTRESAVGDRGTEPFYTASLAKVVVAVDMLDRRRLDGLTITDERHRAAAPGARPERRQRDERALDQVRRAGRGGPGARAAGADRDQRPARVRAVGRDVGAGRRLRADLAVRARRDAQRPTGT